MVQKQADLTFANSINVSLQGISAVALKLACYTSSEVSWSTFCELNLGKRVYNQALHFALLHFCQML